MPGIGITLVDGLTLLTKQSMVKVEFRMQRIERNSTQYLLYDLTISILFILKLIELQKNEKQSLPLQNLSSEHKVPPINIAKYFVQ